MSVLLFRLRGVPEDEANDIRKLLAEHEIAFYETDAGNWGISLPAIWLPGDEQLEAARALVDAYQVQRQQHARQTSPPQSMLDRLRSAPLLVILCLAAMLFILYVSLMPFLRIPG